MDDKTQQLLKNAFSDIAKKWDDDIIPVLKNYIKIPNKSPMFDKDWQRNGFMHEAMQLIVNWCKQQPIANMEFTLLEEQQRTPFLMITIPGQIEGNILLYGHMDKQPEMKGWHENLGPWKPVIEDDKLYGRGGADDGYACFCALTAIATLQKLKIPHANCILLIEASEESGSNDLPYYLQKIKSQMPTPDLIICLDSGAGNYEQLWGTTALRGLAGGDLKIETLTEGVHSGMGSGILPSVFMVLRQLLDRIENAQTGEILIPECHVTIPDYRIKETEQASQYMQKHFFSELPFKNKTQPTTNNITEAMLNNTWRPALSITGMEGVPNLQNAGNVTLPDLEVKLSMRLPPLCNPTKANAALKKVLESHPPFNAKVTFTPTEGAEGWQAPQMSDWLIKANDMASQLFFNKPAAYFGNGGTIPFMSMLSEKFPRAQFLITGVLGPKSNAHGPNEFLHIPMVKKLTGAVAAVIAQFNFPETNP